MRMRVSLALVLMASLTTACGDDADVTVDATTTDAAVNVGVPDATRPDAARSDAAGSDAASVDAAGLDAAGLDAAAPDAAWPDAAPPDTDEDGVADPTDNCPTWPNPDQADADADGAGDLCDLCPSDPRPTLDADSDGVGDLCDAEVVDLAGDRLIVPAGTSYVTGGSGCYLEVVIDGTVVVTPSDGATRGSLELVADTLALGASGAIVGTGSGYPGGALAAGSNLGGHVGSGAGAGCGGGPGFNVGQGGSGAGHGGTGGIPTSVDSVGNDWGACNLCDVPTLAHCHGAPGSPYGLADDATATIGSGGGAAGNSGGCIDGAPGGAGGAAIVLRASHVSVAGDIAVDGTSPDPFASPACDGAFRPGGGGGAGGTIILAADDLTVAASSTLSAVGGQGGAALGSSSAGWEGTWAWSGGGGGGGRVKIFAPVQAMSGSAQVTGGAGGTIPLASDPNSYAGSPGSDGTVFASDTIPAALASFTCI